MSSTGIGLALLVLAVLTIPVSRARTGDYLPPATLFLAAWSGTLGLFFLRLLPYPALSQATTLLLVGAVALFLAGAVLGQRLVLDRGGAFDPAPAGLSANGWVLAYCGCGLTGVAWYIWMIAVTLGYGAISDPFTVRRALGNYQIPSAFLFLEFFCIAAPLLATALWLEGQRLSKLAIVGALLCAAATWLTTDRTQFFTLVLGAFFIFVFNKGPRLSWTRLAMTLVGACTLLAANFLIVGALMGKTPANLGVDLRMPPDSVAGAASPVAVAPPVTPPVAPPVAPSAALGDGRLEGADSVLAAPGLMARFGALLSKGSTLYLYASGSYGALNTLIEAPGPRTHGVYTIYPLARLLERLGLMRRPVPSYIPFNSPLRLQGVENDISFNGYTFLVYPLFDFGMVGAMAYAGVVGLLSGAAYGWARRRRDSALAMLVMAHLSIALVLSIFVNKFNNTASWYIAIVSVLPLLLAQFRPGRAHR